MLPVIIKDFSYLVSETVTRNNIKSPFIVLIREVPGDSLFLQHGRPDPQLRQVQPGRVAEVPDHRAFEGCTNRKKVADILISIVTGLLLLQLLQELQGGGCQEEMLDQDAGGHH